MYYEVDRLLVLRSYLFFGSKHLGNALSDEEKSHGVSHPLPGSPRDLGWLQICQGAQPT